jgi:hypothetical protein
MSQNRADSPESIYDTLVGDSVFSSLIGSYKFVNEPNPVDSIVISSPGAKLPQLSSQTGLEVIIHDAGQVTRMDYLTDSSEALVTWKVYLIVWPPANGTTITNAAKRMIEIFANSTAVEVVSTPNEIGAMVQTLVLIPDNALIMN